MDNVSDERIMMNVKQGKLADLSELFERYHIKLYNFFLKLTFDKAISQDLTQNLFIRIIRYRHTFSGNENSFKPWIYQMARNVHADHYRKQKKYDTKLKMINHNHVSQSERPDPYDEDDFRRLDEALLKLRPEQREILVLSRFQGLKYDDISKIKNVSVSALKVQVHRTMKELRKIYFND